MGRESAKGSLTAAIDSRSTDGGSCAGWSDPRGRECQTAHRTESDASVVRRVWEGRRRASSCRDGRSASLMDLNERTEHERGRRAGVDRAQAFSWRSSPSLGGTPPVSVFSVFYLSNIRTENRINRKQNFKRGGEGGGAGAARGSGDQS